MQIEDNGMGIKKENLDKLFNDFQKLNEHKAINTKGTGLGLSVCKQIIELMGGKVYASSLSGIGTKFNIILQFRALDRIFKNPENQQIEKSNENISQLMNQQGFQFTKNFENYFIIEENLYESLGINSFQDDYINDKNIEKEQKQNIMFRYKQQAQQENQNQKEGELHLEFEKMIMKIQDLKVQQYSQMEQQSLKNNQLYSVNNDISKLNVRQFRQDFQDISNYYGSSPLNEDQNPFQKNLQVISNKSRNPESDKYKNQLIQMSQKLLSSISSIDYSQKELKHEKQLQKQNQFVSFADLELNKLNYNFNQCSSIKASMLESRYQDDDQMYQNIISNQKLEEESYKQEIIFENQEKNNYQKIKKSPRTLKKEIYLRESIIILKKYKQQKLRVLIANDDPYSLFVVQTTLEQFNYIQKVDAVQNGQLALEFVIANEKSEDAKTNLNKHHYYDVVFLDLEMPILNGYDACTAIKSQYNQFNNNLQSELLEAFAEKQVQSDSNYLGSQANEVFKITGQSLPIPEWILDLKKIYDRYQELRSKKIQMQTKLQFSNDSEKFEDIEIKLMKIFNTLYANQRYQLLQYMNRPFIFAYSAMINSQVKEQTKKGGFDNCIDSPLSKIKIEKIFADYLNLYVFQMTKQMLEQLGNAGNFVEMIDDARIKKVFLESSSEFDKSLGSFINTNSNLSKEIKILNINELNNSEDIQQIKSIADQIQDSKKRKNEEYLKMEQKEQGNKNSANNVNLSSVIEEQEKDDWSVSQSQFLNKNSIKNKDQQFEFEDIQFNFQQSYFENIEFQDQNIQEQNQNDFNFNSKQNNIIFNSFKRSYE